MKSPRFFFASIAIVIVACIAVFLFYGMTTRANISNFYASSCLGDWKNPEKIIGLPQVTSDLILDYSDENSASVGNVSAQVYCGGFSGEIPKGTLQKKVVVKFSWAKKDLKIINDDGEPVLLDEVKDEAEENVTPEDEPVILDEEILEPTGEILSPVEEKTGFLNFIFPVARAQVSEQVSEEGAEPAPTPAPDSTPEPEPTPVPEPNVDPEPTPDADPTPTPSPSPEPDPTPLPPPALESIPEPTPTGSGLEILYTLDGETWHSLGFVSEVDNSLSFEIPIENFSSPADLARLQIAAVYTVPLDNDTGTIYLDSIWLEVLYEEGNLAPLTTDKVSYTAGEIVHISGAQPGSFIEVYQLDSPNTTGNSDVDSRPSNVFGIEVAENSTVDIEASMLGAGSFVLVNTRDSAHCSELYLAECRSNDDYLAETPTTFVTSSEQ